MKNPWVIIGIIIVVLIGGSVFLSNTAAKKNNVGVEAGSRHLKGGVEAKVTLVEYSDFQCPACQAFQPALTDVLTQFGDNISFEYKHFPLPIHPLAEQAARAAEAAGQQGKFFEFHDKLFAGQKEWSASPNPAAFFMRYAQEIGLDVDQFTRQMKSTILRDEVRSDKAEAAALELTGTPTFILNGKKMEIRTFEDFMKQIAVAVDPNFGAGSSTAPATEPAVKFGI